MLRYLISFLITFLTVAIASWFLTNELTSASPSALFSLVRYIVPLSKYALFLEIVCPIIISILVVNIARYKHINYVARWLFLEFSWCFCTYIGSTYIFEVTKVQALQGVFLIAYIAARYVWFVFFPVFCCVWPLYEKSNQTKNFNEQNGIGHDRWDCAD